MKLKLILCMIGMLSLFKANASAVATDDGIFDNVFVELTGNGIPYDILTNGDTDDHRSIRPQTPIFVMLDSGSYSLNLYFDMPVGEVEVTVSRDGSVVYSGSEYIESAVEKSIQLEFGVSGNFLIEIEGKNGAYSCGEFKL